MNRLIGFVAWPFTWLAITVVTWTVAVRVGGWRVLLPPYSNPDFDMDAFMEERD